MAAYSQNRKKAEKGFSWTEEEAALLVKVIIDYKACKSSLGLDWETVKSKYEEITERFRASYPKKESGVDFEQFPKCEDITFITKDKVMAKIKRIKANCRKAVDSGRRSGGGRVVSFLYKECFEIWCGSPAVDSIPTGIESVSLNEDDSTDSQSKSEVEITTLTPLTPLTNSDSLTSSDMGRDASDEDSPATCTMPKIKDMGACRRDLLVHLKSKRDSKLTKRTSSEAQLLESTRQEITVKKRIVESIELAEKKHEEQMEKFNENMNSLTAVIGNGFAMIQMMMQNQINQQGPSHFVNQQPFHSHQLYRGNWQNVVGQQTIHGQQSFHSQQFSESNQD